MGQTSENVGADFDITREAQDRFAAWSYQKAEKAQKEGWFADEIAPITVKVKDAKSGEVKQVTLMHDEGIRAGTTYESLSKIRPAFKQFGDRSTGGNSSQVTDGGKFESNSTLSFTSHLIPITLATPNQTTNNHSFLPIAQPPQSS